MNNSITKSLKINESFEIIPSELSCHKLKGFCPFNISFKQYDLNDFTIKFTNSSQYISFDLHRLKIPEGTLWFYDSLCSNGINNFDIDTGTPKTTFRFSPLVNPKVNYIFIIKGDDMSTSVTIQYTQQTLI